VSAFSERDISFSITGPDPRLKLGLIFEWVNDRTAFQAISANRLHYRFLNFDYSIGVSNGTPSQTPDGVQIMSDNRCKLVLNMAQTT